MTRQGKQFEVWCEGYNATGTHSRAVFFGTFPGETFRDACKAWVAAHGGEKDFNEDRLSYWGCKMFDNEADARKNFG